MPTPILQVSADFPPKLQCLFQPKRYKVLYGGRGAGRSWGIARALLIMGTQRPIRVLCAREFQNSIADSVHQLLRDQIEKLGLSGFYEVQQAKVIGINGTTFSFEGIKNNTLRIKSYEGVDYCWVEEAVKVSEASWNILIPTIRRTGSEIWLSFNPELEEDYTYKRFVKQMKPERGFVVFMTYEDNPWFDQDTELKSEMEDCRELDYDTYLHVWKGQCVTMLKGAVYAKQLRRSMDEGHICEVPWDRDTPVDAWVDLGKRDMTSLWLGQRVAMQFRMLEFFEDCQEEVSYYISELQRREYNYGTIYLPHDAKAKRLGMKKTIEEIFRSRGFRVQIVPKLSIADGINAARMVFPTVWFDKAKCELGLTHLKKYRYEVKDGVFSPEPLHDEHSHAADAFRYFSVMNRRPMTRAGEIKARLEEAERVAKQEGQNAVEFSGRKGSIGKNLGWMN